MQCLHSVHIIKHIASVEIYTKHSTNTTTEHNVNRLMRRYDNLPLYTTAYWSNMACNYVGIELEKHS